MKDNFSESDEEVPLKKIKKSNWNVKMNPNVIILGSGSGGTNVKFTKLLEYSMETCTICCCIFHTKYDYYTHYATHMSVAVEQLPVHICKECKKHFITRHSLNNHKCEPDILTNICNKKLMVKCEDTLSDLLKNTAPNNISNVIESDRNDMDCKQELLENIVKNNLIVKCEDSVTQLINKANDEIYISDDEPEIKKEYECDAIISKIDIDEHDILKNMVIRTPVVKFEDTLAEIILLKKENKQDPVDKKPEIIEDVDRSESDEDDLFNIFSDDDASNITSRLLFEESDDEMEKKKDANVTNKIMFGTKKKFPSVHYDVLTEPGEYCCKYCNKEFENRYQTICHETTHIGLRRPQPVMCQICDRYIAGNYRNLHKHISIKHPSLLDMPRKAVLEKCQKCGLRYNNYSKHSKNYHYIYRCKFCGKKFDDENERDEHSDTHGSSEPMCNMLPSSMNGQISQNGLYQNGQLNEIQNKSGLLNGLNQNGPGPSQNGSGPIKKGEIVRMKPEFELWKLRKCCEMCYLFLKKGDTVKHVVVKEISEVGKKQPCEHCNKEFFAVKLVKSLRIVKERKSTAYIRGSELKSNAKRLKNIQHRLKALNKLSRF